MPAEFGEDLDLADDVAVELVKFLGWDPVLGVLRTADDLDLVPIEEVGPHLEARHVPNRRVIVLCVPITSNLSRVRLVEDRIEDWLLREARWKRAKTSGSDQVELELTNRTKESGGRRHQSYRHDGVVKG